MIKQLYGTLVEILILLQLCNKLMDCLCNGCDGPGKQSILPVQTLRIIQSTIFGVNGNKICVTQQKIDLFLTTKTTDPTSQIINGFDCLQLHCIDPV